MIIKLLEEKEINMMKNVLKDDNMIFDINNLKNFINTPNTYGFIAKDKDEIIGFAYCYGLTRPDKKIMFYIHSIGVLPEFQNQGIGSEMMKFIVEFAKAQNFSEIFVITDKSNLRACHLYEKYGFKNDISDEVVYVNEFVC